MRTATIDAILGPVAEAVGELLLANEEAELNDVPLPDLTGVALVVGQSVQNLLNIAKDVPNKTEDEDVKIEMPLACHELDQACETLTSSIAQLNDDPLNTTLRAAFVDGAKGILVGTQKVLEVFDDYEVRKIIAACTVSKTYVNQLRKVNVLQELIQILQPCAQSLVKIANLADSRIAELVDPWLKVELAQARDTIRTSSTLLVSSLKVHVMNPSQPSAKESRDLTADKLFESIAEVERIVLLREPPKNILEDKIGKLAAQRIAVMQALAEIASAVQAQDEAALEAALNKFYPAADEILANAKALADRLQDPVKKAQVNEIIARIGNLRPKLAEAARFALQNPHDADAQQRLLDLMKDLDAEFAALEKVMNEAAIDDIFGAINNVDTSNEDSAVARLIKAARAGDVATVNAIAKEFTSQLRLLQDASKNAAANAKDPESARAIMAAQKFLDDLHPQLIAAAKTVALNPNDPTAQEHLAAVVKEWETGVARLKEAIANAQAPEDVLSATAKAMKNDLAAFERACVTQNPEALKAASKAITTKLQTVNNVIKREIDNSDDPVYQEKLRKQQAELNQALPELQAKAKAVFVNPKDAAALEQLQQASNNLVTKVEDIQETVHEQAHPAVVQNKFAALEAQVASLKLAEPVEAVKVAGAEDAIFVDEPLPELLDAEEAKANPIKASAMELKLEASKWDSTDNKMIQVSNRLADLMAQLSEFAKMDSPTSKKDLINAAKLIAQEVKAIEEEARKLAESCTDKRLKADLIATAQKINTMGQQLKILATVKAANPSDNDNDQLLIGCATGLMAAVSQTITASHAASIRSSFKSTANVTVAAVKWRRLVHKADPSGKPKSLADALKGSASSTPAVKPAVPNSSAALAATNALKSAIASAPQTTTPTFAPSPKPAGSPAGSPAATRSTIGQPLVFRTPGKK